MWISNPGYVSHVPIARAAGLRVRRYTYLDGAGRLAAAQMLAELEHADRGDVVVLQACCHNPTGVEMTPEHWAALTELCIRRGLIPLVDIAYLGFGEGLDADAAAVRAMARQVGEMLIAVSLSKSFGLYRERVGGALVLGRRSGPGTLSVTMLENLARTTYSTPPDHGASVVSTILDDSDLSRLWSEELAAMRSRLRGNRVALTAELHRHGVPDHLLELGSHAGMFSVLPHTPDQMRALRSGHGIYGTDSGRINLAGMREREIPRVAHGIAAIYRRPARDVDG